jgi:dinuclear metal center YbgI/SA1388 family protein
MTGRYHRLVVTTIGGVLGALVARYPLEKAAGWDPVGLQLGDPAAPAASVAVCHEVTERVVVSLESDPVDLVIAYHPLLFHPTNRLVHGADAAGRAFRLVRAGAALAVLHTAFDVALGGAADALASALGIEDPRSFGPVWGGASAKIVTYVPPDAADPVTDAMAAAGGGIIGNYHHCSYHVEGWGTFYAGEGTAPAVGVAGALNRETEIRVEMSVPAARIGGVTAALVAAHPYEEPAFDVYERRGDAGFVGRIGEVAVTTVRAFADRVGAALGGSPRIAGDGDAPVTSVAAVPGSGSDFLTDAAALGADVVVTGDVSHHTARASLDRGTAVIDPGHAATERPGVERLYAAVGEIADDVRDLGMDDPWSGA